MDAEGEASGRSRWLSPAGISALAAAAAVVVGFAGLIVQLNDEPGNGSPGEVGGQTPSSTSSASTTEPGSGQDQPSATGSNGSATSTVPAACVGCTPEELAARQSSLDLLTTRLAAPSSEYCKDTTETFTDGPALARVGCSFPGDFDVDYALWSNEPDLSEFTKLHRDQPDAVVQEWRHLGASGPVTGTTIEFVADGSARFYWTYDKHLISGNAQHSSGEQERLNDWWRTSGALMRESSSPTST